MVSGVELVTVFLLAFCYVYGARCGCCVATAFSLLRCFLFGFYPDVILLYLIYYNAFALLFGTTGRRGGRAAAYVSPAVLLLLAAGALSLALAGLPVSPLLWERLLVALWALFAVLCFLAALSVLLLFLSGRGARIGREAAMCASLAAAMTVLFTLLSDVITPLCYGWSADAALGFFYTGFFAMIPQTLCAAVSVSLLFYPLEHAFSCALPATRRKERARRIGADVSRKMGRRGQNAPSNDGRTQKDMV